MKKQTGKRLQKAMALMLSAIIVLSAFAVLPANLFLKAGAAELSPLEERYEAAKKQIEELTTHIGSTATSNYTLYSPASANYVVPDGEYVITGTGGLVMTNGLQATSTTATGTGDTWFFERQSNGKYYIKTADGQYLNINSSGLSVTANAQQLVVRVTRDGVTTIGDGKGYYINYSGDSVDSSTVATNLTLNTVARGEVGQTKRDLVKQTSITSGEKYVVTSKDGTVMTYNTNGDGHLMFSGTATVDSPTWTFTASGDEYQIQTSDGRYLVKDSGSTWPVLGSSGTMGCSFSGDVLTITFKDGCDTMRVQKDSNNLVSSTSGSGDHTSFYIYKIVETTASETGLIITAFIPTTTTTATPIDDGGYVVYNQGSIMGHSTNEAEANGHAIGINQKAVTVSGDTINTLVTDQYYFEHVEDNRYYVSIAAEGEGGSTVYQYLTFNGSNNYLAFTPNKSLVKVYVRADGTVCISDPNSSAKANNFTTNGNIFSSYTGGNPVETTNDKNEIFTLYRNPAASKDTIVRVDNTELYNVLHEGIGYALADYTEASYNNLLQTLEDGITTYNDSSIVDATVIAKAVANIRNAIANLERLSTAPDYRTFPATIYKFGYNPSATSANAKYSAGGAQFNAQTYASMEEIIRADANLMEQIANIVDIDANGNARTWSSDSQRTTALNTVITAYAEIYSLAFTGNSLSSGGTSVSNYRNTAWNVWTKTDTTGSSESSDGGASVQGIYSAMLNNGSPADHAPYSALAYGNVSDYLSNNYNTANGISVSFTAGSSNASVTLPALKGISVHINDVFTRENVLVDGSTTNYSKYYWDFDFPFVTETNEYGVNTYKYSSREDLFQASYNDANHTAEVQLTPKSGNTGFFPFNNQLSGSSPSGSVYHFGMNFSTEFYVPASGTYADGEDIVFEFSGDDDVLVYVDDVLVLDNGGLHAARKASINFTDASVSYQFAMNLGSANATVEGAENTATYTYGNTANLTGDELAALEKLNEVRTDGEYHTFTFYYLERGSNESNCEIEFNMQYASNHVLLHDETLVVDYGLPVEYNIKENDKVDEIPGLGYSYEGIVMGNQEVESVVRFDEPTNLVSTFASENDVLNVQGLKYGTATMRGDGLVTYTPNTMNMTDRDYFYSCAEIAGDPTYTTNYYQYERAVFIPATTIYYEDNFGANISFKDGSGAAQWTTVGDASAFADAKQAADLVDDVTANPYGYDPIYAGNNAGDNKDYTMYSGFSAQKVTVSKNLATNPTVEFTFTGTGFDIISMTDSTTGAFYVDIFDANNKQVGKKMVVDTYYGYSYGQLYADANGKATLTETDTPLYKSAVNEAIAINPTYYSVDGIGYTETPTYYDAYGNITETETENPAYAYAYGWVTADDVEGLYQIPVIKKTGLDYGTYTVVITPIYSRLFDNTGKGQFDVYIDAIRIYDPAGKDDNIDSSILTDYKYDNESYPNYLTIKDMLIGADSLSKDSTSQGVVFIDGIAALDNDLEKLKLAGPNNELYLAKGQAVAFEIWATAIPDEVQLGVKSVKGKPTLGITYNGNAVEKDINTATEMNYIINNLLPEDGKLAWSEKVVDGVTYYRTDTVVIQNLSDDSSILSLTSMKWTFTGVGQHGHYEVSAAEPVMMFMSRRTTVSDAYAMMSAGNVPNDDETDNNTGSEIIPDDNNNTNDTNDTNDENQGVLTFIQRIIEAITNFFKKIFGLV